MKTDVEEEFAAGLGSKRECKNPQVHESSLVMSFTADKQQEEEESNLGASAMSVTTDVPKVTRASGLEMKLKRLPSTVGETNADTKHALRVEIRKFGRRYEGIFKLLEGVKGSVDVKKEMVEYAIKEAARLKKRHLIHQLEMFLEEVQSEQLLENKETPNI